MTPDRWKELDQQTFCNDPFSCAAARKLIESKVNIAGFEGCMFPDRDAMYAFHVVGDLADMIIDQELVIPGIDRKLIRDYAEEFGQISAEQRALATAEYDNLYKYVAELMDVDVARMQAATTFWLSSFLEQPSK